MINLLRRVRRNTVTEKKPSLYVVYAIGEVVLVVVGILIAIYIDKGNQRKTRNEQFKITLDQVYTNLKCDLDVAIWDLDRVQEQGEVCESLLNNQEEISDLQLLRTLHYLDWYPGTGFLVSNFDHYVGQLPVKSI